MLEKYIQVRDFNLRKIPVLGGAGLLGGAVSAALSSQNATPIIVDKNEQAAKLLLDQIVSEGGCAEFMQFDLSDPETLPDVVSVIEEKCGPCDGWVNSFYPRTVDWGDKLEDIKLPSWRDNVDMHLTGTCICSNEIARRMAERKAGSIVNIGSIYGLVAPNFSNYQETDITSPAAYSAIKGGISAYSKYLASYYGPENVRVNSVVPGGISNKQPESFVKRYIEKTALRIMAEPEEVACAVVFLLSDAASYITGVDMPVDGGYLSL